MTDPTVTHAEHIQGFEVAIVARQDGDEDVRLSKSSYSAVVPRCLDGGVRLNSLQREHLSLSPETLAAINERLGLVDFGGDNEAPPETHEDPGPLGKSVQVLLKSGPNYNGIVQAFDRDGLTLVPEPKPGHTRNAFYFPMSSVDYLVWPVEDKS